MARPVTMFTGQWADLPVEELARRFSEYGYDGLELACWGDHFEVEKAIEEDDYCAKKREMLEKYHLQVWAISAHLVGQAVLDNIDERHKAILPPYMSGETATRPEVNAAGGRRTEKFGPGRTESSA